jgi:hypothetical protein
MEKVTVNLMVSHIKFLLVTVLLYRCNKIQVPTIGNLPAEIISLKSKGERFERLSTKALISPITIPSGEVLHFLTDDIRHIFTSLEKFAR